MPNYETKVEVACPQCGCICIFEEKNIDKKTGSYKETCFNCRYKFPSTKVIVTQNPKPIFHIKITIDGNVDEDTSIDEITYFKILKLLGKDDPYLRR
jgi:hypothetical protein